MADWQVSESGGLAPIQQRLMLNGRDIVGRTMRQVLMKRLPEAVQYARTNYLTGGTTSTRLAERTGRLKQSFDAEVLGQTSGIMGRIGYIRDAPSWASVHEGWPDRRSNTTIHPRTAKYLAIPLTEEARQARPRSFANTFVQTSRAGNVLIFQKTGSGGIVPLYLLRTSVTIPSRPALYPTMDKFLPLITQDLNEALARALRGS
jgi:hypothetical protein